MNRRIRMSVVLCGLGCLALCGTCLGLVMTHSYGMWPSDWPKELEPFRKRAETADVAHGVQETIYGITFKDRAEFEAIWPVLLHVKTPGAPIVLYSLNQDAGPRSLGPLPNEVPCVRILAALVTPVIPLPLMPTTWHDWVDGTGLRPGEPVEYLVRSRFKDAMVPRGDPSAVELGFIYRARTDLELVVDGKIIDLNRIQIPAGTRVIDKRLQAMQRAPATQPATSRHSGPAERMIREHGPVSPEILPLPNRLP